MPDPLDLAPGTALLWEECEALIVGGPDADVIEALLDLVEEAFGGPRFESDNKAIEFYAQGLRVTPFVRCSGEHCPADCEWAEYGLPPGCVRDACAGETPAGWWLVTNASAYFIGEHATLAEGGDSDA